MKSKVSVLLVVSLLILSLDLPAKERRGAELVVQKNDGQVLKGELIAVKQNSVLLLSPEGADVSVDIKDIYIIKIVKKSKALTGAGIGFLAGALTGVLLVATCADEPDGLSYLIGAGGVGAIFGGVGLLVGAIAGPDKEIKIEGKSDAEIKEILEKLRRQARVPNAQ